MPRSKQKSAPSQAALSIRDLLDRAKASIEAGESHMHQAADDVATAYELSATQAEIAASVGKSQPWVCGLLKWHRSGMVDTPFGPKSKAARARQADNKSTNNSDDADDDEQVDADNNDLGAIRNQHFAKLSGLAMEATYTSLVKNRQLYEGACELPWSQYFDYRDQHPAKCTPLTSDDLVYVRQWTSAGPDPATADVSTDDADDDDHPSYSAIWMADAFKNAVENPEALPEIIRLVGPENFRNLIRALQAAYDEHCTPADAVDTVSDIAEESAAESAAEVAAKASQEKNWLN